MAQTNVLALPLVGINVITGTNEDWIDSLKYVVTPEDLTLNPDMEDWPQLDLRGIDFEMDIRRSPTDHEVIITANTKDGTLAIGAPPNYGYLLIHLPYDQMKYKFAGSYVGDIRASGDGNLRTIIQIDLDIYEGVTKTP